MRVETALPRRDYCRTGPLILLVFFGCCVALLPGCHGFPPLLHRGLVPRRTLQAPTYAHASNTDQEGKDRKQFLDKASKLRQEVASLESKLRTEQAARPVKPTDTLTTSAKLQAPVYSKMDNSVWTMTYRFASTPESSNEKDSEATPRDFFRGKLTVQFRDDGYTNLVAHEPGDATASKAVSIIKTWGWDEETSAEDEQDYVMFSVDVQLPETVSAKASQQRFYLQARKDLDGDSILLKEGTVTMKTDAIDTSSPGFWALFSPKGILAQFRYVGDFVAKPSASSKREE